MSKFYFTFGMASALADVTVVLLAENENEAREAIVSAHGKFAGVYMTKPQSTKILVVSPNTAKDILASFPYQH